MDTIGEKIRDLRHKKKLSIRALGELSGIPWNTIARIERGLHSRPRWETVATLLGCLGTFRFPADNSSTT